MDFPTPSARGEERSVIRVQGSWDPLDFGVHSNSSGESRVARASRASRGVFYLFSMYVSILPECNL